MSLGGELWDAESYSHLTCSYFLIYTISHISNFFNIKVSNNFHSHTSVWFSSSPFGSAASWTCFMYNNQTGYSPLCKSWIVSVCVQYVCVFQTSPLRHGTAAHMVSLFTRQRYSKSDVSMYSSAPCCRVASVRK